MNDSAAIREYRATRAINASALKAGRLSMAHMNFVMFADDVADTPTTRWGSLMHIAALQPAALADLPVWGGDRRGKSWMDFRDAAGDAYIVSLEEMERLQAARAAFVASGAAQMLAGAECERPWYWDGGELGACKALVDAWIGDRATLVEYKTTRRIDKRAFLAQCESLGYLLQIGWYAHAARYWEALSCWPQALLIAQESAPPYCVAVYQIGPHLLEQGYKEAEEIARRYRAHELCGQFPGPYDGQILAYERPGWAVGEAEVDLSDGEMEGGQL